MSPTDETLRDATEKHLLDEEHPIISRQIVPIQVAAGLDEALELVDTTRETPAHDTYPALPQRALPTTVFYPATDGHALQPEPDAPAADGTFPLVVHSHGFMSGSFDHEGLGAFAGGGGSGGRDQPARGRLVRHRRGARRGRPPGACSLGEDVLEAPNPPLLIMHGDADAILPIEDNIPPLFDGLTGPRWLATLASGTHTGFPDASAGLFDGLEHADILGCGQIAGALPDDATNPATDELDGVGGVLGVDCAAPCEDESMLVNGMKPTRQVELSYALVRAFLDSQLQQDPEGTLWLEAGVGLQEADVAMSAAP